MKSNDLNAGSLKNYFASGGKEITENNDLCLEKKEEKPLGFGGFLTGQATNNTNANNFFATKPIGFNSSLFGGNTNPSPFASKTNPSPFGSNVNPSSFALKTNPSPFGLNANPSSLSSNINPSPFTSKTNPSPFDLNTNPTPFEAIKNSSPFVSATAPSLLSEKKETSPFSANISPSLFNEKKETSPFNANINPSLFGEKKETSSFSTSTNPSIFGEKKETSPFNANINSSLFGAKNETSSFSTNTKPSIFCEKKETSPFSASINPQPFSDKKDAQPFSANINPSPFSDKKDAPPFNINKNPSLQGENLFFNKNNDQTPSPFAANPIPLSFKENSFFSSQNIKTNPGSTLLTTTDPFKKETLATSPIKKESLPTSIIKKETIPTDAFKNFRLSETPDNLPKSPALWKNPEPEKSSFTSTKTNFSSTSALNPEKNFNPISSTQNNPISPQLTFNSIVNNPKPAEKQPKTKLKIYENIFDDFDRIKELANMSIEPFIERIKLINKKIINIKEDTIEKTKSISYSYIKVSNRLNITNQFRTHLIESKNSRNFIPLNVLIGYTVDGLIKKHEIIQENVNENLQELIISLRSINSQSSISNLSQKSKSNISEVSLKSNSNNTTRIENIKNSLNHLKRKIFLLNNEIKAKNPQLFDIWKEKTSNYSDPEEIKLIFKSSLKPVKEILKENIEKNEIQIKSRLLEKSDLRIKIDLPDFSSMLSNIKDQRKNTGGKSTISKIISLKEELLLKIKKEQKAIEPKIIESKVSEAPAPSVKERNAPMQEIKPVSVVPSAPAPAAIVTEPPKAENLQSNPFNQQFKPTDSFASFKPAENLQSNPFAGTGFGQPTGFAAPSNLPNMSGLAGKTFGVQSNPLQAFSGFSAPSNFSTPSNFPTASNFSAPSNPNPSINPMSQPIQSSNPTSSFFKLRK